MREAGLALTFRGVRGSVPTPEPDKLGIGGHTSCLEIVLSERHRVILDCGSGLLSVERELCVPGDDQGLVFDVLLSHFHTDHILGLPLFQPLYDARNRFTFHGRGWENRGLQETLEELIRPPLFPIALADTAASKEYADLPPGELALGPLRVRHAALNHPQGVIAFRVDHDERSVVFATDNEWGDGDADERLTALASNVGTLIHDAQYTPTEYRRHRGWGHSSWEHAVEAARAAGAGRLVLFHHDPERSDADVRALVEQAAGGFPRVDAAREGLVLPL